jgi:hypothetical protein
MKKARVDKSPDEMPEVIIHTGDIFTESHML